MVCTPAMVGRSPTPSLKPGSATLLNGGDAVFPNAIVSIAERQSLKELGTVSPHGGRVSNRVSAECRRQKPMPRIIPGLRERIKIVRQCQRPSFDPEGRGRNLASALRRKVVSPVNSSKLFSLNPGNYQHRWKEREEGTILFARSVSCKLCASKRRISLIIGPALAPD